MLDWSALETADLLEISVAAANSALQRARATLRERLPSPGAEWPVGVDATAAERDLLKKYLRSPGDTKWRALALDVFRIEGGVIAEGITFSPEVFPSFGLPLVMDSRD